MNDKDHETLIKAAWIGTSVGSLDLGLAATEIVATMPSEQLAGATAATVLTYGYILAGVSALYTDLESLS